LYEVVGLADGVKDHVLPAVGDVDVAEDVEAGAEVGDVREEVGAACVMNVATVEVEFGGAVGYYYEVCLGVGEVAGAWWW
jgi:hypothetical protein